MTSALPAAASAKYLSSFGSWHSRTVSVGSIRSAATTTMSRTRWRRSTETKRSNFGRKITSRYSSSTSCDRISRLGGSTARNRARSGRLFALRAAETKVEASMTTIKPAALPAFQQTAQVAADRFATGRTLQRLGGLGVNRDHHVNRVLHTSLHGRAYNSS